MQPILSRAEISEAYREKKRRIELYVTHEEFENIRYLKRQWKTLHTRSQVVNAAVAFLAKATREGLETF